MEKFILKTRIEKEKFCRGKIRDIRKVGVDVFTALGLNPPSKIKFTQRNNTNRFCDATLSYGCYVNFPEGVKAKVNICFANLSSPRYGANLRYCSIDYFIIFTTPEGLDLGSYGKGGDPINDTLPYMIELRELAKKLWEEDNHFTDTVRIKYKKYYPTLNTNLQFYASILYEVLKIMHKRPDFTVQDAVAISCLSNVDLDLMTKEDVEFHKESLLVQAASDKLKNKIRKEYKEGCEKLKKEINNKYGTNFNLI